MSEPCARSPRGPIGVIGLGKMGLPIASHLASGGYEVRGYDTAEPARRAAGAAGVRLCGSVADLCAACAATLIVVGFDHQVVDVCRRPGGIFDCAAAGHVVFICSTVSPETSRAIGLEAESRGIQVLDAPLCGGEAGAVAGELLVMGAGDEQVLDQWREAFSCFARQVVHLGGLGAGQAGKLVNNLFVWINCVGSYEALRLGMRLGADQEKLRQALLLAGGDNPMMRTWHRPRPMPWAEDDMRIVTERADALRLPMPLAGVVRELIKDIKLRKAAWGSDPESYESMFDFVEFVESAG